jgi:phosphatidylglycerophosphate synthase
MEGSFMNDERDNLKEKKAAPRIVGGLTGAWEKPYLIKTSGKLPKWVNSDHLTLLGIVGAVFIAAGYALTGYSKLWILLAQLGLYLNWFGDSLDGTLARVRHEERERYGYFIDHMVDAFVIVFVCMGLGISPLMDLRIALFIAIIYLLFNIYCHILTYVDCVFKISFGIIGPTEFRIIIFLVNIVLLFINPFVKYSLIGMQLTAFDIVGILLFIIFTIVLLVSTFSSGKKYNDMDVKARESRHEKEI